jgi:transcriptional regulator with XRE-family HTH domain
MKRGTITKIAKKAGISLGYMANIINGKRRPVNLAAHLEAVTGVPKEVWVFGGPEKIKAALAKKYNAAV